MFRRIDDFAAEPDLERNGTLRMVRSFGRQAGVPVHCVYGRSREEWLPTGTQPVRGR